MCNSQSNDLMKRQMMKTSCISNVPGQDFKSCSKRFTNDSLCNESSIESYFFMGSEP